MHVLLIHQVFVSPTDAGGTRHYELSRRFVEAGHRFTIVASTLSYLSGNKVSGQDAVLEQNYDGVRVLRAYTYPSLHRSYLWRIVSFLSFMVSSAWKALRVRDVDVVMGTSPPIFQAFSAWLVSVLKRRPLLLEVRDLWPEFAIDIGLLKNPFLIWIARRLERFLYARASHIVVNSPAYRDYLIEMGVPAAKVSFIANGVDPDMFQVDHKCESLRDEYGLQGKFLVTYAGALGMANNLEVVLEAASRVRDQADIHFLLVGDGKERAMLEKLKQDLVLPNVTFAGARRKSEMPAILNESDVCLATLRDIPMFRTTYPNKVFDYMAAARPTVLGIDGVIREVIEKAGGGIPVPPGNSEALADAIHTLYQQPETASQMGTAAREYVIRHFDRNDQAVQFRELMHKVAKEAA